jgi:hypothetical protein
MRSNPARVLVAAMLALTASSAGCRQTEQAPPPVAPQPPAMQRLAFKAVSEGAKDFEATAGPWKFTLLNADDAQEPTAWEGPLRIQSTVSNTSCEVGVSLITAVYSAPGAEAAVVVTYSGSLTYVHFIGLKSCKELSATIRAFTEGVEVSGRRLTIQPGCESAGAKLPSTCSAAQVFELDKSDRPQLLEKESLELTQRVVGVAFQGTKKVKDPKSPAARIVE